MEPRFPGMDFDFLRYMGVLPENQRRIQSHYLPYFEKRSRVVDLACGDADFVELLVEQGIDVVGVDSDDKSYAAALAKGLPVVKQDVFEWLTEQPAASVDGVFSAHLIEHLPYPMVIELIEQSFRILQPGGIIVLATPNARAFISHLEMFYTHFGHVTFYHPRLVNFFLDRAGFVNLHADENPVTASHLLPDMRALLDAPPPETVEWQENHANQGAVAANSELRTHLRRMMDESPLTTMTDGHYRNEIPVQGRTPLHYLSYWLKRIVTNLLVRPLTDALAADMQERVKRQDREHARWTYELAELLEQEQASRREQLLHMEKYNQKLTQDLRAFAHNVQQLNGAFEAFNWAIKPENEEIPSMQSNGE